MPSANGKISKAKKHLIAARTLVWEIKNVDEVNPRNVAAISTLASQIVTDMWAMKRKLEKLESLIN